VTTGSGIPGNSQSPTAASLAFAAQIHKMVSAKLGQTIDGLGADHPIVIRFLKGLSEFMTRQVNGSDDQQVNANGIAEGWVAPGGKALIKWCKGEAVPSWKRFDPVFQYLCEHKLENDSDRVLLHEAWTGAVAERSAGTGRARRIATTGTEPPEPGASDFYSDEDPPRHPGLVAMRIDPPARGTNAPNLLPIRVSLSFAESEDMIEKCGVKLGVKDAMLVPTYEPGCAPERNSRAGEADNPNDFLALGSDVWLVIGPKPNREHLDGKPLGDDQPLLTLRVPGQETDGLSLTLRSKPKALVVIPDDPEDESRITKDKLLQLLLQRTQDPDNDGWITWGRARLRRKKPA
jgi:hypothetical protein